MINKKEDHHMSISHEAARAYALQTLSQEVLLSPALFEEWFDCMLARYKEPKSKTDNRVAVTIYTDGACSGNPGPGGWGAVLILGEHMKELSGGEVDTTNNRMELLAAIRALEALKRPCRVTLYSDSAYLVNAFEKRWIDGWQRNGWKNSQKKPVENQDLWLHLIALTSIHNVGFVKVKGHADNQWNNRCDQLAVAARENIA
jgi:ribonuclease HI